MTRTEALAAQLDGLLAAGRKLKDGLEEVQGTVAALLPLTASGIETMPAGSRIVVDAFLLRFANLAMLVHDPLLRSILLAESETLDGRSRRDALNLAAKLGAIAPGIDPDAILAARHRLAHTYPNDPSRQAALVNQVFSVSPMLVAMFDGLADHVKRRGLASS